MKIPEKLPEGEQRQGSGSVKGNLTQGPRRVEGVNSQICAVCSGATGAEQEPLVSNTLGQGQRKGELLCVPSAGDIWMGI